MGSKKFLNSQEVRANIKALVNFMEERNLDGFYISSFDEFLNEYVPDKDCHRYYLTGFTGSTAEVLVTLKDRIKLYVDGRYYEQADIEVDSKDVEVVKVPQGLSLYEVLYEDVKKFKIEKLGLEADRTRLSVMRKFKDITAVRPFYNDELSSVITFQEMGTLGEIKLIPSSSRGRDIEDKLKVIFAEEKNEAYFLTALDDVAWISNCRGFHLPYQSAFRGRALVTSSSVYVFVNKGVPLSTEIESEKHLKFIEVDNNLEELLKELQEKLNMDTVYFDPTFLNVKDFKTIESAFPERVLKERVGGLVPFQSIKDEGEKKYIEESFKKSNKAIYNTIVWFKEEVSNGKKVSELDLQKKCLENYQAEGALELSFGTIPAIGANGSIIHYGLPSEDVIAKNNDLVLLDSGAYYDGGFATDTTRTFLASSNASDINPESKKIYTLVLKGLLNAMNAVIPEDTVGSVIDGLARTPINRMGYNYNHGTGHGMGINVHAGGVRFAPGSTLPTRNGHMVSVEPGIYIPGFGGVRLENVVFVENHPSFEGMLRFKNLVWIGFDHDLIDKSLLNSEELSWLDEYEKECKKQGTSFLP